MRNFNFCAVILSNIHLVKKKDGESRPHINLAALNKFIPYKRLKMGGLHCLKYVLEENDFPCKIDLKYAYFSVLLCISYSETLSANRIF